jgi:hypothetical protein
VSCAFAILPILILPLVCIDVWLDEKEIVKGILIFYLQKSFFRTVQSVLPVHLTDLTPGQLAIEATAAVVVHPLLNRRAAAMNIFSRRFGFTLAASPPVKLS